MSRTGGIIESVGDNHSISLTFSTKKMDTFTTYIIIENCHNPHNVKTVRVNFKVEKNKGGIKMIGKRWLRLKTRFFQCWSMANKYQIQ